MSKKKKIIGIVIGVLVLIIVSLVIFVMVGLGSVSKTSESVSFTIKSGSGRYDIVDDLYDAGLLKNKYAAYLYVTVNFSLEFDAGVYSLDRSSEATDILKSLTMETSETGDIITITFVEGKRVTDVAQIISEEFGYEYDEVISVFSDRDYASALISKYDFLTDEVLDSNVIYPLEGYLFPNTYEFYKTESIKGIIEKMLSETNMKINSVRSNIDNSGYSVHEILSIASIVEMEAVEIDDRKNVAQVIYTRLAIPMSLGMDVTSYYGVQKSMKEELTQADLDEINGYNTRPTSVLGLPIGPICNPSFESITAALNPSDTNDVYFCADLVTGEVHFQEDYNDFVNICR